MTSAKLHSCIALAGIIAAAWCGATFGQQSGQQSGQSGQSSGQQSGRQSQQPTPSDMAKANQGGKGDAGKLARKDRSFMEKASRDSLAEVEAGKLAASKAESDSVKKFAGQMVQDHGKAADEL